MKIHSIKTIVCSPGRNFVTVKITTDEGVHGIGDATLNGRELAVAAYLDEHVIPCLIGRDAHRIEDTWQYLYKGAYWRRGPVTMAAISAVDTALWDIKAKVAKLPLYQLFGGSSRERLLVYGHANGESINNCVEQVARYRELGYQAIRAQCGVPGLADAYGVSADKMFYEPASGNVPRETVWSTRRYLAQAPKLFARLREEFGDELHLLHDVHHRLTPNEAAQLGRELEPYRLYWLEDATPAENQEAFRLIRSRTTTPLAVGEVFNTIWDCKRLIEEQLIDYIRMSVVHGGGPTHLRRVLDFASLYQVKSGCHGATDLSPVSLGAALHLGAAIPNFGIQEYMRHSKATDEVFPHDYRFAEGHLFPGDSPGHGVDIDEELAGRYPYERAYLPVNRLEDGTVHDW